MDTNAHTGAEKRLSTEGGINFAGLDHRERRGNGTIVALSDTDENNKKRRSPNEDVKAALIKASLTSDKAKKLLADIENVDTSKLIFNVCVEIEKRNPNLKVESYYIAGIVLSMDIQHRTIAFGNKLSKERISMIVKDIVFSEKSLNDIISEIDDEAMKKRNEIISAIVSSSIVE